MGRLLARLKRAARKGMLPWKRSRAPAEKEGRHVVVVHKYRLAYLRVPKAANTSIRAALAEVLDLNLGVREVNKDAVWMGLEDRGVELISPREFAENPKYRDYFSFAVVRDPAERLASAYKNKVKRHGAVPGFAKRGFSNDMSFSDFVRQVCSLSDEQTDIHLKSQVLMTTWRGKVLAEFVFPMDDLHDKWPELGSLVKSKCGLTLPTLKHRNSTARSNVEVTYAPEDLALVKKRYLDDYRTFFPEQL